MPFALAIVMLVPISLHNAGGISKAMVKRAIAEVDAIWREAGVAFDWHTTDDAGGGLHVEVGDQPGGATDVGRPLAWIQFVGDLPLSHIYMSRANALRLLGDTPSLRFGELPPAAIDEYVGRALGRALAHEIGHYLFRSRNHDATGVMATNRSTTDLFSAERDRFKLTKDQRARLTVVFQRNRVAERASTPLQ